MDSKTYIRIVLRSQTDPTHTDRWAHFWHKAETQYWHLSERVRLMIVVLVDYVLPLCLYVYVHMHIVCEYVNVWIDASGHVCMYVCMYICMYVNIYIHTHTKHTCTYIHTYMHTYIHTKYAHTYIHTYICCQFRTAHKKKHRKTKPRAAKKHRYIAGAHTCLNTGASPTQPCYYLAASRSALFYLDALQPFCRPDYRHGPCIRARTSPQGLRWPRRDRVPWSQPEWRCWGAPPAALSPRSTSRVRPAAT
jgi:hypothetical protein